MNISKTNDGSSVNGGDCEIQGMCTFLKLKIKFIRLYFGFDIECKRVLKMS